MVELTTSTTSVGPAATSSCGGVISWSFGKCWIAFACEMPANPANASGDVDVTGGALTTFEPEARDVVASVCMAPPSPTPVPIASRVAEALPPRFNARERAVSRSFALSGRKGDACDDPVSRDLGAVGLAAATFKDPNAGSTATTAMQRIQLLRRCPTFKCRASAWSRFPLRAGVYDGSRDVTDTRRASQLIETQAQRRGPQDVDIQVRIIDLADAPPARGERPTIIAATLHRDDPGGITPGHLRKRSAEHAMTELTYAHAIVHVPKGTCKPRVESICLFENVSSGHQARPRHGTHLLDHVQMLIDIAREVQTAAHHALVRNRSVWVAQADANRADTRALARFEHDFEPVAGDDTGRRVEQHDVVAAQRTDRAVDRCGRIGRDDDGPHPPVWIRGESLDPVDTIHGVDVRPCDHDHIDRRRPDQGVAWDVETGARTEVNPRIDAAPLQCIRDRSTDSVLREWLVVGRYRGGARNHSPGVEHVGHVSDLPRSLGDAEHQIVVLAPVEPIAESARRGDKRPAHHREVVDVVLGE